MKTFIFLCLLSVSLVAQVDGEVIQIQRAIRMRNEDPLPPKTYVVSVGKAHGIAASSIFKVTRLVPVLNAVAGGPSELLEVPVTELRIIQLGEKISIATENEGRQPSSLSEDLSTIALGDRITLAHVEDTVQNE